MPRRVYNTLITSLPLNLACSLFTATNASLLLYRVLLWAVVFLPPPICSVSSTLATSVVLSLGLSLGLVSRVASNDLFPGVLAEGSCREFTLLATVDSFRFMGESGAVPGEIPVCDGVVGLDVHWACEAVWWGGGKLALPVRAGGSARLSLVTFLDLLSGGGLDSGAPRLGRCFEQSV
jgi:hypothetical protein